MAENQLEKERVEVIVTHDYMLLKGRNIFEGRAGIQIPIQEARLLLEELLKEDYLQKEHTDKYPTYKSTEYTIRSKGWTKSKVL